MLSWRGWECNSVGSMIVQCPKILSSTKQNKAKKIFKRTRVTRVPGIAVTLSQQFWNLFSLLFSWPFYSHHCLFAVVAFPFTSWFLSCHFATISSWPFLLFFCTSSHSPYPGITWYPMFSFNVPSWLHDFLWLSMVNNCQYAITYQYHTF